MDFLRKHRSIPTLDNPVPAMPIITIHAVLARWPLRHIIFSAATSLILIGTYLYFLSLRERGLSDISSLSFDPSTVIAYVARLLTGVVAAIEFSKSLDAGWGVPSLTVGLVLLGLYVFGCSRIYFRSIRLRQNATSTQSTAIILTSACIAIALMTYVSRPGDTLGLVSRYYIISILFVLWLPGLFLSSEQWGKLGTRKRSVFLFLALLFVVVSLRGNQTNQSEVLRRWHVSAVAAIGADFGVFIPGPNRLIGPPMHTWKSKTLSVWSRHRVRLKERGRYSPFSWRGHNVNDVFNFSSDQKCFGVIDNISSVPGYIEESVFIGWARYGAQASENTDWIVASSPQGNIIGLGAPRRYSEVGRKFIQKNFPKQSGISTKHSGVAGYVGTKIKTNIRFYAVKDNQACEIMNGYNPERSL